MRIRVTFVTSCETLLPHDSSMLREKDTLLMLSHDAIPARVGHLTDVSKVIIRIINMVLSRSVT